MSFLTDRPNILLITTDQHRGDHLSVAGHPVVETPNLDAFVNQGAYFPNAYSEIPSTTGARLCMLRGRGSYYCGLIGYAGVEWNERNSLAEVLARHGYHCINVGWRNLHPRRKLYGFHTVIPHDLREGMDDYMEWLREKAGPEAHEFGHGLNPNGWTARPWHLDERLHPVVWTVNKTLEQIRKRDPTRPFFVWCSFVRPHSPYDPPKPYWEMFIHRELPEIPVGDWAHKYDVPNPGLPITAWYGHLTPEQNRRMRAAYMAMVSFIDSQIGRMLTALQRDLRVLDDTLIIFTSDHGDMMGDHHLHRKTYAYEGSARIPFLVRYPKGWDLPTGTFKQPVGLQDVMPTILEAAGIRAVEGVTGRSVFAAIRGEQWREFIHGEHSPCYSTQEAMHYLTDGREKYIWLPASDTELFFDLTVDRQERRNLAKDPAYRKRVDMWRNRLIELLAKRGDGFSDGERLIPRADWWSPVVKEKLQS
ncbi:MAG: arylsulfatase [Candidatus Bathyarchaeota archaeon B26-2]|nr:MAG: arylsulfatase [Candidatus Bathyarchaeota archaeon B26-2]